MSIKYVLGLALPIQYVCGKSVISTFDFSAQVLMKLKFNQVHNCSKSVFLKARNILVAIFINIQWKKP